MHKNERMGIDISIPYFDNKPYLLTPGPLTTSPEVRSAMQKDWGSWDSNFRNMTLSLRHILLDMAHNNNNQLDCVPIQGSGTFAVEAMLGSFTSSEGKTLILSNGAYGKRCTEIMRYLGRAYAVIDKGDYLPPFADEVSAMLSSDPTITDVVVVHCETSSGILNPIKEISEAVYTQGRRLLIDAMSSFGAIDINHAEIRYEALASSANKCIEGVPGFGFVIAEIKRLEESKGNNPSLSLDLHAQWDCMNKTGQWRFTPPTHVVAAFIKALELHQKEGGVRGRFARYSNNRDVLVEGMQELGFETLLNGRWLSPIIVTFLSPNHKKFSFDRFYNLLKERNFIIYPGKLTVVDSFRVGCIGYMDGFVMRKFVDAVKDTLDEMGIDDSSPSKENLNERMEAARV